MGIFNRKLTIIDPYFGKIKSFAKHKSDIGWCIKKTYLSSKLDIYISGNKTNLYPHQKKILISALKEEEKVKIELDNALVKLYENPNISKQAFLAHNILSVLTVIDDGFVLIYLNIHDRSAIRFLFKENEFKGISVDD